MKPGVCNESRIVCSRYFNRLHLVRRCFCHASPVRQCPGESVANCTDENMSAGSAAEHLQLYDLRWDSMFWTVYDGRKALRLHV
jgi:hypothetical protein